MPHAGDISAPSLSKVAMDRMPDSSLPIDDTRQSLSSKSSSPQSRASPPSRRSSVRSQTSQNHSPPRRSKLDSPVFTSLREKDDPYFLALPDASRSKMLSNSAADLNTLPHPPPRAHRRNHPDPVPNGNGRLMEQLHSSRRHSSLGPPSQSLTESRRLSRRSTLKSSFRLQLRPPTSSGSSSPNCESDESEIFDDDHSNVGSAVSTRPSSLSSTTSFQEFFVRPSPPFAEGKPWKRHTLNVSASDLSKKQEAVLAERDHIQAEDCRFLESEYHRFVSLSTQQQGSCLRRHLLPVFARPCPSPPLSFPLLSRKCAILLKYQNALFISLAGRSPLSHHERNTILEAVACICERHEWREYARGMYDETNFMNIAVDRSVIGGMVAAMERFREHERMTYHCVSIAMEYLSRKKFSAAAVEFCGRVLAVAFFYSPGVAVRLVHALNVATPFTARLLDEVCDYPTFRDLSHHTPFLRSLFPKHLHELIYSTPQKYNSLLTTCPSPTITIDSNLTISFAGEWVHRWRAHNSDVFFSFLRHWHVILSEHLSSAISELTVSTIAATPGYLIIQGHVLRMVDSFIHRQSNELPAHPLPAPHHHTLAQSSLCKRALERHPSGPLGPPLPRHFQQGKMQDSIHAVALLLDSGDGRPQGIEKAEKKLAKALSSVLIAVRKTQSSKPVPVRPGLMGAESDDTLTSGKCDSTSEGDVSSTPRTISISDMSSLISSNKSMSSDRRISLSSLQLHQYLAGLFCLLFERTLKAAVRRTSVWDGQACFALCDILERLVPIIDDSVSKVQDTTFISLDWPFWTNIIKLLVLRSENSITQVRAFGLLFNLWERFPRGDEWLLEQHTWEMFFCHWSTLVRCYFMNLVCWRVCMSRRSDVSIDPATILCLKRRLETAQRHNAMLIRHAQANGLPFPVLKASNPLPNMRLVVVPISSSTHVYGITFDSMVPASPVEPTYVENDMMEIKSVSLRSEMTGIIDIGATTGKEEKKGFRLNIFKGVFGKNKSRKSEASRSPNPPAIINSEVLPPLICPDSPTNLSRHSTITRRQRKLEIYQFSMEPVPSRLESNKGIKERPTPSHKTIEKFLRPGPVPLPRYARDRIRNHPSREVTVLHSDDPKWRYAGRALAEWELIVKQCDAYVDTIIRQRESIPEETTQDYLDESSSSPVITPPLLIEQLHIPRMTVELPRFYFTGKSSRDQ